MKKPFTNWLEKPVINKVAKLPDDFVNTKDIWRQVMADHYMCTLTVSVAPSDNKKQKGS
jgi:hypothetical protein